MPSVEPLSALELNGLRSIALNFVSSSYWEDETIKRYRALGLVSCEGARIHLTEGGTHAAFGTMAAPIPITSRSLSRPAQDAFSRGRPAGPS
jgi:hypothetical protein